MNFDLAFDYNDIANLIATTALVPLGLFIYYYATRPIPGKRFRRRYSSLWRSTTIGRVLMVQKITWFFFMVFILHSIFLDYPAQWAVRAVVYVALVAQFWVVFFVLRRLQKTPLAPTTGSTPTVPPKL